MNWYFVWERVSEAKLKSHRLRVELMACLICITTFSCFGLPIQDTVTEVNSVVSSQVAVHLNLENILSKGSLTLPFRNIRNTLRTHVDKKYQIFISKETDFTSGAIRNRFLNFNLQYHNRVKFSFGKKAFPHRVLVSAILGYQQWRPRYRISRLLFENPRSYFNPERFLGLSYSIDVPLTRYKSWSVSYRGYTGKAPSAGSIQLLTSEFFLRGSESWKNGFGFQCQVGLAPGIWHLVNLAVLTYRHTYEKVRISIKLGKLVGVNRAPYGARLAVNRSFRFISLGFYYEERLGYTGDHIAGINIRVIGPSKLSKMLNTFRFGYSVNTNSLYCFIPLVRLRFSNTE